MWTVCHNGALCHNGASENRAEARIFTVSSYFNDKVTARCPTLQIGATVGQRRPASTVRQEGQRRAQAARSVAGARIGLLDRRAKPGKGWGDFSRGSSA